MSYWWAFFAFGFCVGMFCGLATAAYVERAERIERGDAEMDT